MRHIIIPPPTHFVCPSMSHRTGEMDVANEQYHPTEADLRARPDMLSIAHEILICPCGQRVNWFQVREVFRS